MIFDTDVLIGVLRDDPNAIRLVDLETDRSISIVSLMELIQGAKSKGEIREIRTLLVDQEFCVVPVDETISYAAVSLLEDHAHSVGLHLTDALIAATAKQRGEVLATANVRHFRAVAGLELKPFRPGARQ
jgi:predicted nucleic acid-binding protein